MKLLIAREASREELTHLFSLTPHTIIVGAEGDHHVIFARQNATKGRKIVVTDKVDLKARVLAAKRYLDSNNVIPVQPLELSRHSMMRLVSETEIHGHVVLADLDKLIAIGFTEENIENVTDEVNERRLVQLKDLV